MAFDTGGPGEIAGGEARELVARPNEAEEYGWQIGKLLMEKGMREELQIARREWVERHRGVAEHAQNVASVYEHAVSLFNIEVR